MEKLRLKTVLKLSLILLVVSAYAYCAPRSEELIEIENTFFMIGSLRKEYHCFGLPNRTISLSNVAWNATVCVLDAINTAGGEEAGFGECMTALDSVVLCLENTVKASGFNTSSRAAFTTNVNEYILKNETCSCMPFIEVVNPRRINQSIYLYSLAMSVLYNLQTGDWGEPPFKNTNCSDPERFEEAKVSAELIRAVQERAGKWFAYFPTRPGPRGFGWPKLENCADLN